jgi:hypothetical protein
MKRTLFALAAISAVMTSSLAAQQAPAARLSVEPYIGYGFFGSLPETASSLEAGVAYGGRASFQMSPQWGVYGNYQRAQSELRTRDVAVRDVNVDHWSAGVEFSFVPRGGAEGMLPIIMEAGLGQARYDRFATGAESDLAVKLGLSSALQLNRNFGIRYGVDDYISNFRDNGIVNQIFVRVGAELSF